MYHFCRRTEFRLRSNNLNIVKRIIHSHRLRRLASATRRSLPRNLITNLLDSERSSVEKIASKRREGCGRELRVFGRKLFSREKPADFYFPARTGRENGVAFASIADELANDSIITAKLSRQVSLARTENERGKKKGKGERRDSRCTFNRLVGLFSECKCPE